MKVVKIGHVNAIIDLYEKLLSTPDWEFEQWYELRKKIKSTVRHMDRNSVTMNCTMKELELSIEPVRNIVSAFDDWVETDERIEDFHDKISDEANDLHVIHLNNIQRDEV